MEVEIENHKKTKDLLQNELIEKKNNEIVIEELDSKIELNELNMQYLKDANQALEKNLQDQKIHTDDLKNTILKDNKESKELNEKIESLHEKIYKFEVEIKNNKEFLDDLNKKEDNDVKKIEENNRNFNQKIESLTNSIYHLKTEIQNLQKKNQTLIQEKKILVNENENFFKSLEKQNEEAKQKNKLQENLIHKQDLKITEFQAENIHLKDSFSQLQCEKNELEKTIEFNKKDFTEKIENQKKLHEELIKKHQDQIKESVSIELSHSIQQNKGSSLNSKDIGMNKKK